jgi:hypothetical protein
MPFLNGVYIIQHPGDGQCDVTSGSGLDIKLASYRGGGHRERDHQRWGIGQALRRRPRRG